MSNYPWHCLRWLFGFCSARLSKCAGFRVECRAFQAALPAATMRGQVAQSVEQRTDNMPIKDWPIAEEANLTTSGQVKRSGRSYNTPGQRLVSVKANVRLVAR